ncbi:MAG: biopolymer transporter ExbD [Candidatus Firestonebacteria bacterium]|jgi:biopolymer transport protein TolR|nr:biopolymer transporter ExbD [Candidatus Firestonebacteria bacterium]
MGMQTGGEEEEEIYGINITPLVDVCLVLVIIFMVTAPMMVHPNMDLTLPKASTKEAEEKENITISIGSKGEWAINQDIVGKQGVAERLLVMLKKSKDKYIVIRADKDAPWGAAEEALSMAKKVGAKYALATEQKK